MYEDFEAGAENMELRAMQIEADRALDVEFAMYEAEEEDRLLAELDEIGATMAEYEAVMAFVRAFQGMIGTPEPEPMSDDIPF